MTEQASAASLPVGSVVVDDVVGVAFYAVEELGISERWHESDTPRGNATVDHAIRRGDAQIVRVGTRAAIAPDARERLAGHLYARYGVGSEQWDNLSEDRRNAHRMQADEALAVITGKEN